MAILNSVLRCLEFFSSPRTNILASHESYKQGQGISLQPSWSTHCQSMSLGASSLRLPGFCRDLLVLGFRLPVAAYYLHALDTWCAAAMLTFSEKLVKYLSVKLLAVLRDIGYRHAWRRADVSTLLPTFPGDHDWRGLPPSQKTNELVKGDNHVVLFALLSTDLSLRDWLHSFFFRFLCCLPTWPWRS